jgi:hypothetical protein
MSNNPDHQQLRMDMEFLMIRGYQKVYPMISHAFRSFVLINEEFLKIKRIQTFYPIWLSEFDPDKDRYARN